MHLKTFFILTFVFFLSGCSSSSSDQDITGFWQGTLKFPGFESRIIFKIVQMPDEKPRAYLLKPDDNDDEIALSKIEIEEDRILLTAESLQMIFNGRLDQAGQTISGRWRQKNLAQKLVLTRIDKIEKAPRPQTPPPPFPYLQQEVTFANETGNAVLAGTLTRPSEGAPCPAVILVSGGGAHDRDYTIARHKPFLVIADYLARHGIVTLRFDERGVGGSTGNRSHATIEDIANDVLAAVDLLQTSEFANVDKIGLLGHSEGGMIAELAATKSSDIAFLITLGTPGLPGYEYQLQFEESSSRAIGMDEGRIAARLGFQKRVFDILLNEPDSITARQKLDKLLSTLRPPLLPKKKEASLKRFLSPWFRFNLGYDPAAILPKIKCPVLAIFGEKDLQVPPERNADAVRAALRVNGNSNSSVAVLPDINHFFQTNSKDIPFNYGKIEETISPQALQLIGDWILNLK